MTARKPRISLVPWGDARRFQDKLMAMQGKSLPLEQLLNQYPAMGLKPIDAAMLSMPLSRLRVNVIDQADPQTPLYWPEGLSMDVRPAKGIAPAQPTDAQPTDAQPSDSPDPNSTTGKSGATATVPGTSEADEAQVHPQAMDENTAVRLAYGFEIDKVAGYLRTRLSALVYCDKLVVRHLAERIVKTVPLEEVSLAVAAETPAAQLMPQSFRQRQLAALRQQIKELKEGQVLVLPYLDLLAGGGERGLSGEARELTEVLYEYPDKLLLAFADRSLSLPDVVADRFATRVEISGVPRVITSSVSAKNQSKRQSESKSNDQSDDQPDDQSDAQSDAQRDANRGVPLLGEALVTSEEAALFRGYQPRELYKNVAGLNPIRLRNAMTYAVEYAKSKGHSADNPASVGQLIAAIREFKAETSAQFDIPRVTMDDIGGYDEVKATLGQALQLMAGAWKLPREELRRELIPRGFLLYGPPGTGKTLFAKAVANQLNATIRVVSGPEVTDKYVGESERNVRELFAEARRNAPAVIVFDEFDAIAGNRSSRDDGGSRAGNALVAQILTEMDGFRPDVPMLVIGTSNRLELIDEALLRPSRFQPIAVDLPDERTRRQIAAIHARHFAIDVPDVVLDAVARATNRMNGDQIRSLFRDACVAMCCQDQPPTAEHLGFLVGRLQAAAATQRLLRSGGSDGARSTTIRLQPRTSSSTTTEATAQATTEATPNATTDATADTTTEGKAAPG